MAVAFRRGGAHVVLSPALVQGQEAPSSLLLAIDRIERHPSLDVLIIGRGGGSNEDLMAFNDERVVRRLAAVRVPVVSAVGHDVNTTLADWVADVRAATPSEAAELVVMDAAQRQERLLHHRLALRRSMARRLSDDRATLQTLRVKIADPRFTILQRQQLLDEMAAQLAGIARSKIRTLRSTFDAGDRRLRARHPLTVVACARNEWVPLSVRLPSSMRDQLSRFSSGLAERKTRLMGLSPIAILSRGYAVAYRLDGRAVRSSVEISVGDPLCLRLHQGGAMVTVQEKRMPTPNIVDGSSKGPKP